MKAAGSEQDFVEELERRIIKAFPELKSKVSIYLLTRISADQDGIMSLSEEEGSKWLGYGKEKRRTHQIQSAFNDQKSRIDTMADGRDALKGAGFGGILYTFYEVRKKDSRLEMDGCGTYKDLYWIAAGAEEAEWMRGLTQILMDKVRGQLHDLLMLDEWQGENMIEEYLFSQIEDRESVMRQYVRTVFNKERLPGSSLITVLSAQKYEQRDLHSRVLFVSEADRDMEVAFKAGDGSHWRFDATNMRFLRKILETVREDRALVVVSNQEKDAVIAGIDKAVDEQGLQIRFNGYMNWELTKDKVGLLHYKGGEYHFPSEVKENTYYEKISFLEEADRTAVQDAIEILKGQSHGTSVVFLDRKVIEKVLSRLVNANRAYPITPTPFGALKKEGDNNVEDLILGLSSIDGALIADYDGKIHAIGAILDGEAVVKANAARGARFNSLQNYVNWLVRDKICGSKDCFAAILSEDGTVDVEIADRSKWIKRKKASAPEKDNNRL